MKYVFSIITIVLCFKYNVYCQTDTEYISINKISNNSVNEFNISDVKYKDDDESLETNDFQLKLYIPVKTELKLNILDSMNNQIRELVNEKFYDRGVYKIKWKMNNNLKGKFIIEMVTDQFVYTKDFFIVNKTSKYN